MATKNGIEKINEIISRARSKQKAHEVIPVEDTTSKPLKPLPVPVVNSNQLPLWPNFVRALPNPLARSALFNVSKKTTDREFFKSYPVASVNGVTISYTGEELRQRDEDVFLQLLHIAKDRPLGDWVEFTAYSLVKAIGWSVNTRSYNDLRSILDRLSATNIIVSFNEGKDGYAGSLVRKFIWKTAAGEKLPKWRVYFEPEIIALFAPTSYTHIYWELRLSLSPTAKWLHSFYSTHETPFDYKVETLWKLCGSSSSLRHFRQSLIEALDQLKEKEFFRSWELNKEHDLVHVVRAGDAQRLQ